LRLMVLLNLAAGHCTVFMMTGTPLFFIDEEGWTLDG
jgi:hypothetical protein